MRISKLISILLCAMLLCGCSVLQGEKKAERTGLYFDTVVTVTIYGGEQELIDEAFSLCEKYEKIFSRTMENSELYNLNNSPGGWVLLSDELTQVIERSIYYGELSNGKFDVTIAPYCELWDFADKRIPTANELHAAAERVGYENIILEGNTAMLKNGAQIDLGGIAKGYIADKLAEFFSSKDIDGAVISLGGNVALTGSKASGEKYTVGIKDPSDPSKLAAKLKLGDGMSAVTSGDYERYFESDGVRYHHILDPSSGMPAQSDLRSATVIAKSSADADALSTICYILGKDAAVKFIEQKPHMEAVLIDVDGNIICTSGIGQDHEIEIEY